MSFHQTCTKMSCNQKDYESEFNAEETLKIKAEFKRLKGTLNEFYLILYQLIVNYVINRLNLFRQRRSCFIRGNSDQNDNGNDD